MQTSRLALRRIPPLRRPLRPPSALALARPFTHNSQLLLVISPSVGPRPQLPFLHPSTRSSAILGPRAHTIGGQWQLSRLLTTGTKQYIKEQVWLASKWTVFLWTSVGLLFIAFFGVKNEIFERQTPTPPEWSTITRMNYRCARAQEDPDFWPSGLTDWASTGSMYKGVMERLEDPNIDGAGLKEQSEGGILVPGVGKAGYDVSAKSEAWRRGYHETLMGCAKSAEHLDGWVKDTTRRICFPPEVVIGPSNPDPRPCPPYAHDAPLEQNCVPAFEGPETYYMKVLTTAGFSTRQRLDAALAYADWLDFKGLGSTATEMFAWALDIATSTLPDAASIIDTKTGVIRDSAAARVSPNAARAATALATHHARNADVTKALPIFLSVLRAHHAAPPSSSTAPPKSSNSDDGIYNTIRSLLAPPAYPPPPPTGDEPLTRTPATPCDDAALKTYIGEILFATSASERATGLAWTREAVAEAEAEVRGGDGRLSEGERERCAQCAEVALGNLGKMVGVLAGEEKEKANGKKGGWLWGKKTEEAEGVWEREARVVEERIERMRREGLREQFAKLGKVRGGTWIG